jgi:hypothetical protein
MLGDGVITEGHSKVLLQERVWEPEAEQESQSLHDHVSS